MWAALAGAVAAAQAAEPRFPVKPVRIIVPNVPGGATDTTARHIQTRLAELWGQPVVVDNRAGASGGIAYSLAAKAPPDGYTLLVSSVSITVVENTLAKTLGIVPSRELTGVSCVMQVPHLFVVHPSVAASSVQGMVDHIKKTGVRWNFGIAAMGTYTHLDAIRFVRAAGVDMTIVPYKGGAGQFIAAMLGNEVQAGMINMASSIAHVRGGRLKVLATTWTTRRPELPGAPTMAESGFPGIGTNAWNGVFAPATMPKALVNRIHADIVKVVDTPSSREQFAKQMIAVSLSKSPEDFNQLLAEERKKWRQVVVENNITIQ
jgi:tripartite-type tricarboxylate transporter receptor subunit TctC